MRLLPLTLLLTVSGCIDGNVELEFESSTTEGELDRPEPTTTTSTGTGTTGSNDSTTSVTSGSVDNENQPLEVALSLSHTEISQARSVVVTTTSQGADTVKLHIWETTQLGHQIIKEVDLLPGTSEYEHKVLHGFAYYRVTAERGTQLAVDAAPLYTSLPEPGTFEQTLGPQGTGAAVVLHSNDGVTLDQPTVIGNDLAGNVVFLGQPSPYPGAGPMDVTSAALDEEGAIYVGGSAGGQAVVRKYKNRHLYWEYAPGSGVVHDILVSGGEVMAVGEVENEVTSGAVWELTESGGLLKHHVWEGTDEQNDPLGSSFNSLAWTKQGLVIVGSVIVLDMLEIRRAAVFNGDTFSLCDVAPIDANTSSSWLGVAAFESGFVTVGFERYGILDPVIERATFSGDCTPLGKSSGADGRARSIHQTSFVGEVILDDEPHTYVENSTWNHLGGRGTASQVVIDRHGYAHVAGTILVDGKSTIALTTYHP